MITSLARDVKPVVEFDVNNVDHRKEYFNFVQHNSWGQCKYRFTTRGYGITKGAIDRQLIEHYLRKEFK